MENPRHSAWLLWTYRNISLKHRHSEHHSLSSGVTRAGAGVWLDLQTPHPQIAIPVTRRRWAFHRPDDEKPTPECVRIWMVPVGGRTAESSVRLRLQSLLQDLRQHRRHAGGSLARAARARRYVRHLCAGLRSKPIFPSLGLIRSVRLRFPATLEQNSRHFPGIEQNSRAELSIPFQQGRCFVFRSVYADN